MCLRVWHALPSRQYKDVSTTNILITLFFRCLVQHEDTISRLKQLLSNTTSPHTVEVVIQLVRNSQANLLYAKSQKDPKKTSDAELDRIEEMYAKNENFGSYAGRYLLSNFYYGRGKFARAFEVANTSLNAVPLQSQAAVDCTDKLIETALNDCSLFHCVFTRHSVRILPPGFRSCLQLAGHPPLGVSQQSVAVLDAQFMLSYVYVASSVQLLRTKGDLSRSEMAPTHSGDVVEVALHESMHRMQVLEGLASKQQSDENERRQAIYYNAIAELYLMLAMQPLALTALDRSISIVPVPFRNPGVGRRNALAPPPILRMFKSSCKVLFVAIACATLYQILPRTVKGILFN